MIQLAKFCGFCFGVRNAIEVVENLLKEGKKVATLGNIIHSPQVVLDFKKKGVRVIEKLGEIKKGEVLVIRSHGVPLKIYLELKNLKIEFKDATCPFVKRIHEKVFEFSKNEEFVLVAGDKNHPEVKGILGYCKSKRFFVFSDLLELKDLFKKNENLKNEKILVVAQTTFNIKIWEESIKYIKSTCKNCVIFRSICSATQKRQQEARKYSKNCDFSVVVGGKKSSNTRKLFNICSENCKTFFIENVKELENLKCSFKNKDIFLTAGASTPDFLINEVFYNLSKRI